MEMLLVTSSSVLQGVIENKKTDTTKSNWACCPLWSYFSCDRIMQQGLIFILMHNPTCTLISAAFCFISQVQDQNFYLLLRFLVNISYRKSEFPPRNEIAHGHLWYQRVISDMTLWNHWLWSTLGWANLLLPSAWSWSVEETWKSPWELT